MEDLAVGTDEERGEGVLEDVVAGLGDDAELGEEVAEGVLGTGEEGEVGRVDSPLGGVFFQDGRGVVGGVERDRDELEVGEAASFRSGLEGHHLRGGGGAHGSDGATGEDEIQNDAFTAESVEGDGPAVLIVECEGRDGFADFAVGVFAARERFLAECEGGGGDGLVGGRVEELEGGERENAVDGRAHGGGEVLALADGGEVEAGDGELHGHRGHVAGDFLVVDEEDLAREVEADDFSANGVGGGVGCGGGRHRSISAGAGGGEEGGGEEGETERGGAREARHSAKSRDFYHG